VFPQHGAERSTDAMSDRVREIAIGDASNVVLAKNVVGDGSAHGAATKPLSPSGRKVLERQEKKVETHGMVAATVDAPPAALPPAPDEAPYVYAANDIRPRQAREIELCEKASHFDWQYTGTFAAGLMTSIYFDIGPLKQRPEAPLRLLGPTLVGFTWGGFLSGGYLSLPKCDPLWVGGEPPEGNVHVNWPLATTITVLSAVSAPFMDWTFLGPPRFEWAVAERTARVFIAAGAGILGSLFPYLLPPRTWSARKELDRIRIAGMPGSASLTYTLAF
jgi:hypothetical protein